ncbi:MAG: MazG-like family protein [Chlamydiia bacterium]|nr:MazG-like family protein [Chlamydiia bacterium]
MFNDIRKWADDRDLIESGDVKTQYIKLGEEFGELGRSIIKSDDAEFKDAIGDMVVVLTNLCAIKGQFLIEQAIDSAYETIKNRKGKIVNGSFIKE